MLDGTVSLGKGCFGSRGLLSGGMKALKPMLPCPGPRDISSQHVPGGGCVQALCLPVVAAKALWSAVRGCFALEGVGTEGNTLMGVMVSCSAMDVLGGRRGFLAERGKSLCSFLKDAIFHLERASQGSLVSSESSELPHQFEADFIFGLPLQQKSSDSRAKRDAGFPLASRKAS